VRAADHGDASRHRRLAMRYAERPLVFECEGEYLVGVLAAPEAPRSTAVLVVVGGPQYRAGSHRQFVHFSRRLAAEGFAVLRFDYRGMGDAEGAERSFQECAPDVAAAIDTLVGNCPGTKRVVLWGLCDAASAILLYLRERNDARVAGIVLLNPWVRSVATLSKTHLKHYYGKRLVDRDFWKKLAEGRVNIGSALRAFTESIRSATARSTAAPVNEPARFQDGMLEGWRAFLRPALVILSGNDLTAKEFLEYAQADPSWRDLLHRPDVKRCELANADHTFSTTESSNEVEAQTLSWLSSSFSLDGR